MRLQPFRKMLALAGIHYPTLWTIADQVAESAGYVNDRINRRIAPLRENPIGPTTVVELLLSRDKPLLFQSKYRARPLSTIGGQFLPEL